MRVIVTGSRTWDDIRTIRVVLMEIERHNPGPFTLVSGACPNGADAHAERVATQLGWTVERHPADWQQFGRRAGLVRNSKMATIGGDVCVAFQRDGSRGTGHMIDQCKRHDIPVRIYPYTPIVAGS